MSEDIKNKEYDNLMKEIETTIKEQNEMFNKLNNYNEKTTKSTNIDNTITDIVEKRKEIMRFLEEKYNNNTSLRKKLFDNLYENKKELTIQNNELKFLEDKIKEQNNNKTTFEKKINNEKYKTNEIRYYNNFLFILIFIQLSLLIILSLSKYLGKNYTLILVSIILLFTLSYILYTVFYNNYNRDKTDWNKFYFQSPDLDKNKCIINSNENEDKELEELEKAILKKLRDERYPECKEDNADKTNEKIDSEEDESKIV